MKNITLISIFSSILLISTKSIFSQPILVNGTYISSEEKLYYAFEKMSIYQEINMAKEIKERKRIRKVALVTIKKEGSRKKVISVSFIMSSKNDKLSKIKNGVLTDNSFTLNFRKASNLNVSLGLIIKLFSQKK
jgi:hypothetical protein